MRHLEFGIVALLTLCASTCFAQGKYGQQPIQPHVAPPQASGYWATVTTMQPVQSRVWMQPTVETRWEWRPLEALFTRAWTPRTETRYRPVLPTQAPTLGGQLPYTTQ